MDKSGNTPSGVPLVKIFGVFLVIGALTFGGGYVMLPVMQRVLVKRKNWLDSTEFYDILILVQGLPGPVALNCSILAGRKLRGFKGALVAAAGLVIPSFTVILLIAGFLFPLVQQNVYVQAAFYGIRPAVTALVAGAALGMGLDLIRDRFSFFVLLVLFAAGLLTGVHPIVLLLSGGMAGWLYYHKKSDDDNVME